MIIYKSSCPYCNCDVFSGNVERRPFQIIERCETCLKYCMRSQKNGVRYPLDDPFDSSSAPYIKRG